MESKNSRNLSEWLIWNSPENSPPHYNLLFEDHLLSHNDGQEVEARGVQDQWRPPHPIEYWNSGNRKRLKQDEDDGVCAGCEDNVTACLVLKLLEEHKLLANKYLACEALWSTYDIIDRAATSTITTPAMCSKHWPEAEHAIFGCCRDCKFVPVCTLCLLNTHNKHDVCSLADVMAENTTYLKDAVVVLSGHLGDINTALEAILPPHESEEDEQKINVADGVPG